LLTQQITAYLQNAVMNEMNRLSSLSQMGMYEKIPSPIMHNEPDTTLKMIYIV